VRATRISSTLASRSSAVRIAAVATLAVAAWIGERLEDAMMWPVNLVRDLPIRVARLAVTGGRGMRGVVKVVLYSLDAILGRGAPPKISIRSALSSSGLWGARVAFQMMDLVGVPELWSFVTRAFVSATPLTGAEIGLASEVLGPNALRYGDVRIAEGGCLRPVFGANHRRAFTTFYTINMPQSGPSARANCEILLHELAHVHQYECVGGFYIVQALHAQHSTGYDYGGAEGLELARASGSCYRDFNREQQAKIVQDYYLCCRAQLPVQAYEPFIDEMRAGQV